MYEFIKSLNLSEELNNNEIYYLFKSESSETNLELFSSLQKFNNFEELLDYYTNENSKYALDIFNNLSSISLKIINNSEENYSNKYISGISKIIFLFLLIQKNIELLNDIFKETNIYLKKFYSENKVQTSLTEKINSCINDLINSSSFIDSKRNNSRASTRENTIPSSDTNIFLKNFCKYKQNNFSNSNLIEGNYIFSEIETPKFEEEKENINEKENFDYIKDAISNGKKIKKVDSSLTLSKMDFVGDRELEVVPQLEKTKSFVNVKNPKKANKKKKKKNINNKKENLSIFNSEKDFLCAFLNEISNLYKENKINGKKKIEIKKIIFSNYKDVNINFYDWFDEKKSISENIKLFLITHLNNEKGN